MKSIACPECLTRSEPKRGLRWQCEVCGTMESDANFWSRRAGACIPVTVYSTGAAIPSRAAVVGYDADAIWIEVRALPHADPTRYRRYTIATGQYVCDQAGVRQKLGERLKAQQEEAARQNEEMYPTKAESTVVANNAKNTLNASASQRDRQAAEI